MRKIDFVARDNKKIMYFQVSATVIDEKMLERELRPLQSINDHYPKFILTLDEDHETDLDGIRKVNSIDWLLGDIE